jgi:glycogen synthase
MPRRIAFLTPEYVTNAPTGGGLASYVARMARILRAMGHDPEVFTLADTPEVLDHDGVRVEHVVPADNALTKLLGAHWRLRLRCGVTLRQLRGAVALAKALRQREAQKPFDMVQSADWGLSGLFVPRRATRTHLVRCSWSRKACEHAAGLRPNLDNRLLAMLERRCMRRADAVYAPSRFVADSVGRDAGVTIHVVRPPVEFDPHQRKQTVTPCTALPPRFLLHFGLLSAVKGTDVLLAALPRAWEQAPDLTVILAGRECEAGYFERHLQPLGDRGRRQVIWTGPLSREQLAAILPRADAAVLPSRSDNLPNTVIESLAAGVPVVGSDGASIDELVRPGVNGLLVPIENAPALGDAMAAAWRGELSHLRGADKTARTLESLRPRNAVAALMRLAGCADDADGSAWADGTGQARTSYPDDEPDARPLTPTRRAAA